MSPSSFNRIIRIMVVDDHPALRDGISMMIETQEDMILVAEAANGAEAVAAFDGFRPNVTLMDLQMPGMGGIEAIARIRKRHPTARMILLTTYGSDVQATRALEAGAASYLIKSALRRELLDAIRTVHAGERYLSPSVAQSIAIHAAEDPLSPREVDVLRLVAEGNANKMVALELRISEDTVKTHLRNVFEKLGAADRTQAVMSALRRGIIEL